MTYSVAQHKRTDSGTMDKLDKMATNLDEFKSFGPPSQHRNYAEES